MAARTKSERGRARKLRVVPLDRALPLTSTNWWPLGKVVSYVRAQLGHRDIADGDFLVAVNTGRLPAKIEQRNRRTEPPSQKSILLTPKLRREHELTIHMNNTWILTPRAGGVAPIRPPYALFFWSPEVKKIWPEQATSEHAKPEQRKHGGGRPPFDRVEYLTEAAAYVMVNNLPRTVEDLYLALDETLGKRGPGRTVAMEILTPFHRRMRAALVSGN